LLAYSARVHTSVGIRCLLIGRVHIPVAAIHPRASVVMIWQHHMRAMVLGLFYKWFPFYFVFV
jgi:hypothetical protein